MGKKTTRGSGSANGQEEKERSILADEGIDDVFFLLERKDDVN